MADGFYPLYTTLPDPFSLLLGLPLFSTLQSVIQKTAMQHDTAFKQKTTFMTGISPRMVDSSAAIF